ncbi:MAG: membrane dipeptidase, partial [Pyrinomonadaceae bacterium]
MRKITNRARFPVKPRSRTRWRKILAGSTLILILSANCRMTQPTEPRPTASPQEISTDKDPLSIHRRAIVIDLHTDTTQRLVDEQLNLGRRLSEGHFDSVRAIEGGLDAQFFSIWVEPQLFGSGGAGTIKRADDQIAAVHRLAEQYPETWALATSAAEIRKIASEG